MELKWESKQYCKLCLSTDVKLFNLNLSIISEAYLQILQIPSLSAQGYACYECASLLRKYKEFYTKCSNAHVLLTYINPDHSQITKQMVQLIDRKLNKLESKLSQTKILIDETCPLLKVDTGLELKILSDEIKVETYDVNDIPEATVIETPVVLDENKITTKTTRKRKKAPTKKISKFKSTKSDSDEVSIKNETLSDNDLTHLDDLGNDNSETDDDVPVAQICKLEEKRVLREKSRIKKENTSKKRITTKCDKKMKISAKKEIKENKSKEVPVQTDIFKDYATVITMTKEEAREEMLQRKESKNYKRCMFKCALCYKAFETEITYESHMKRHTEDFGEFECEICHLRFSSSRLKYSHYKTTHTRKFICKMCPYSCSNYNQAASHINVHKGKKFSCSDCGEEFSYLNTMLNHKKLKHRPEVVCDICGSVFVNDIGVNNHKRLKHKLQENEGKGPRCEECGVQFSTETAWKRHLVLSPKHAVSNGCEHCGETFADKRTLKRHVKTHNLGRRNHIHNKTQNRVVPVLPAHCTICGVWLTTPGMYKAHMAASHPDAARPDPRPAAEWICDVCGKALSAKHQLESHLLIHTGERPYQCDKCDRAFRTNGALSVHLETHGDLVVNKRGSNLSRACHLCGKVFNKVWGLTKHIKNVHMKYRPYKCPYCEKAFPTPYEVKVHTQHVHNKEPWPKRARAKPRPPLHQ